MSNGISGYDPARFTPYRQVGDVSHGDPSRSTTESRSHGATIDRSPLGPDLSNEEIKMIDSHFPPSPQMTLRLYGPGRPVHVPAPGDVGGRLDMRA